MPGENVKIRIRVGANEVEIEAPVAAVKEAIGLIPDMLQKFPQPVEPAGKKGPDGEVTAEIRAPPKETGYTPSAPPGPTSLPDIRVEKADSLTEVITKIFKDPWGRRPRKLSEVREVLESYGLIYPKQSVAVALLRLAQSGRLRRFKGDKGEFAYTASTGLAAEGQPETLTELMPVAELAQPAGARAT